MYCVCLVKKMAPTKQRPLLKGILGARMKNRWEEQRVKCIHMYWCWIKCKTICHLKPHQAGLNIFIFTVILDVNRTHSNVSNPSLLELNCHVKRNWITIRFKICQWLCLFQHIAMGDRFAFDVDVNEQPRKHGYT